MQKSNHGPFIYRHPIPEKLRIVLQEHYADRLVEEGIQSIKFGQFNAQKNQPVAVNVKGTRPASFEVRDEGLGVVLVKEDARTMSVFWEIPDGITFHQALTILTSNLDLILSEYRYRISVEETFEQ